MTLLSITEVAAVLGVTRQRVHQIINEGRLKVTHIGGTFAVDAKAVERYATTGRKAPHRPRKVGR